MFDSDLEAKQFRRDTLLGKYQMLLNKLNNSIRVADGDIQCLCEVLVHVNKSLDDDVAENHP